MIQFVLTVLLGVLCWPLTANATIYYVATTGDNANDGLTLETPWRTVNKASTTMLPGDTTFVRGGLYVETSGVRFPRSGTSG
ncbi:MAG: hypothetical protein ACRCZI_09500, partial [Cetobacterium sp.]